MVVGDLEEAVSRSNNSTCNHWDKQNFDDQAPWQHERLASVFNYWQLKPCALSKTDFTKQTSRGIYPCDKGYYKEVGQ